MWQKYRKVAEQEMRPYVPGENLNEVSVSERDTPELGGMIARGADDGALWYVSKRFFTDNYVPADLMESDGDKFLKHIQSHLEVGQVAICKICGKSVCEIIN